MTDLIPLQYNSNVIQFRESDGYINATEMCRAAKKRWSHYSENKSTRGFIAVLSLETGIPVSKIVSTIKGRGDRVDRGTWVHPKVAIHLAQWLSPEFAVWCTNLIHDWMQGKSVSVRAHRRRPPALLKDFPKFDVENFTLEAHSDGTSTVSFTLSAKNAIELARVLV